jgi:chemosensory pili system protein ChpA (sensor histidine kinase/response regulator)
MLSNLLKRYPQAFVRAPDPEQQEPETVTAGLSAQARAFKAANEDIWEYFPLEASEHIAAMRDALDNLSGGGGLGNKSEQNDSVTALFRAAHTLKGSAYMVDFAMMGDFAHELEDLMDSVREGDIVLEGEVISLLRRGVDIIEAMLAAAEGLPNRLEKDHPEVHAQLARTLGKPLEASDTPDTMSTGTSLRHSLQAFKAANEDIWEYFPLEVVEHLAAMRDALAFTRTDDSEARADSDSVTRLFRAAHTLKGSAYMVELKLMGDFAHELEDLMDSVRKGERPLNDEVRSLLQQGINVLEHMLQAAEGDDVANGQNIDQSMPAAEASLAQALGREVKHSQRSDDSGHLTSKKIKTSGNTLPPKPANTSKVCATRSLLSKVKNILTTTPLLACFAPRTPSRGRRTWWDLTNLARLPTNLKN